MRDREYEKEAPTDTYRIALLGSSHTMGSGVADDQTFEMILEDQLNLERSGREASRYEILNFAIDGYRPPQQLLMVEKALEFRPDVVMYVGNLRERERSIYYIVERQRSGVEIPFPYLRDLLARAGVDRDITQTLGERRLRPFADELTSWMYREIADTIREPGAVPIWVFLPPLEPEFDRSDAFQLMDLAAQAGFAVLDLSDVYEGPELESLWVVEWDRHPNHDGHKLIAEALRRVLLDSATIRLPSASATRPDAGSR
jgi:hypothetical protein